ncbi:regulator of chromosome condensation 1/beta-lactamase-inhibitor protein II [Xylariaceae sp. FL0594]|nr:regulator of chromosome condensation 1/beta-lactamase-inhibitor protein II [Xylariaceae sp. FL0594]
MNLYAAGFNAWRQLEFNQSPSIPTNEANDMSTFQLVLSDQLIEVKYASLSGTIVNTSSGLRHAGFVDDKLKPGVGREALYDTTAVAGNGTIAVYDGVDTITQHNPWVPSSAAERDLKFSGMGNIVQLVAYETGFVALSRDGKVWSWGDERYTDPLGREITATRPATRPSPIEDLDDLPSGRVKKIAAGGYVVLALTENNDLYAWGGHPARRHGFLDIGRNITPVVIGENDILDCAVGETHIIVLASDGHVYVTGENTNGQLGLPVEKIVGWEKVSLSLEAGHTIVGVKAGQRSSLITSKDTHHA